MSDFWQRAVVYPFILFLLALLVWAVVGALPAALFFGFGLLIRLVNHLRNLAAFERWLSDLWAKAKVEKFV